MRPPFPFLHRYHLYHRRQPCQERKALRWYNPVIGDLHEAPGAGSRLQAPEAVEVEVEKAGPTFPLHTISPNLSPTEPHWCDITSVPKSRKCALGAPAQPPSPNLPGREAACLHNEATEARARSDVHIDAFFFFVSPSGAASVGLVPSSDGAPRRLRRNHG